MAMKFPSKSKANCAMSETQDYDRVGYLKH